MPNHVSNRLTFKCGKEKAAKVLSAIGGKNKYDGSPLLIDFNKLIPYPKEWDKADREYHAWREANPTAPSSEGPKDGFNHGGYDWCWENWGTKWPAYNQKKLSLKSIYFETAWSPPVPVMDALAAKFPDVPFTLEYADEDIGRNTGVIRYAKGKKGHGKLEDAEAARLYFDLKPDADPKENGYDPITFAYTPQED